MTHSNNTPIIVGVGQKTWRTSDAVAMVRFIADTDPGTSALFPRNPGKHMAQRPGISGASFYQGTIGGNTLSIW